MNSPQTPKIVLASGSRRRNELLALCGIEFTTIPSDVDEDEISKRERDPRRLAKLLAQAKAEAVAQRLESGLVIGADTLVAIDNHILGKPETKPAAAEMLRLLRGRTNTVYTGIAVASREIAETVVGVSETRVRMREYSEEEIAEYVNSGAPMDKSGSYGIQDRPFAPVASVDGCYCNVIGLPMAELRVVLSKVHPKVPSAILEKLPLSCELCFYREAVDCTDRSSIFDICLCDLCRRHGSLRKV